MRVLEQVEQGVCHQAMWCWRCCSKWVRRTGVAGSVGLWGAGAGAGGVGGVAVV